MRDYEDLAIDYRREFGQAAPGKDPGPAGPSVDDLSPEENFKRWAKWVVEQDQTAAESPPAAEPGRVCGTFGPPRGCCELEPGHAGKHRYGPWEWDPTPPAEPEPAPPHELPWDYHVSDTDDHGNVLVTITDNKGLSVAEDVDEGDAAYIVHACNAYPGVRAERDAEKRAKDTQIDLCNEYRVRADAATNEVEELQDELSELRSPAPRGKEAEELRSGVERLLEEAAACDDAVPQSDLQRLLDEVDARDSLSFLAQQDRPHPEPRAAVAECVERWRGRSEKARAWVVDDMRGWSPPLNGDEYEAVTDAADCLEHLATGQPTPALVMADGGGDVEALRRFLAERDKWEGRTVAERLMNEAPWPMVVAATEALARSTITASEPWVELREAADEVEDYHGKSTLLWDRLRKALAALDDDGEVSRG